MSPDATTSPEQPSAGAASAAPEAAIPQAPVSAGKMTDAFANFDEVFGQSSGDGSSDGSAATGGEKPKPAAASGVPSAEATADDDDEEDEDAGQGTEPTTAEGQPPEKKLSRTAKIHEEYKSQIQQHEATASELRAQAAALQKQLDEATGKVSEAEQRTRADQAAFLEAFGDNDEYERRTRIANRMFDPNYNGPTLTNEEAAELARWTTTRDHAEPLKARYLGEARSLVERANEDARATVQRAGEQFQQYIAAQTISRVERYGLDPEVIKTAEYGGLIDHAVDVTTKRLTDQHATEIKERDDKISQLEADLRAAETASLADRTEPLRGGNSADVRIHPNRVFRPGDPLNVQWDTAFGQRSNGVPR